MPDTFHIWWLQAGDARAPGWIAVKLLNNRRTEEHYLCSRVVLNGVTGALEQFEDKPPGRLVVTGYARMVGRVLHIDALRDPVHA